jgi:large conductance mechanosensitive channel
MGVFKEFKGFIMRGNVLDLAVAVIIGGAFGKIVTSFVNDVLMPPIGVLLGKVDFSNLKIVLKAAEGNTAAVTLNYGSFVNTVIDFLIIAFCIFMVLKVYNRMQKKAEEAPAAAPAAPSNEEVLLTQIRDILKEKK